MLYAPQDPLQGFELLVCRGTETLSFLLRESRPFLVGRAPDNDLVLRGEGIQRHHAVVWVEGEEAWIRALGATAPTPLPPQSPLCLGGEAWLEVRRCPLRELYPYRLAVAAPGQPRARAILADLRGGERCVVPSGGQLAVLYLLGRRLREDRERIAAPHEQGWCRNEEVALGVWGHAWRRRIENHLHVLFHRLRGRIAQAGLDPRCVEKSHGASRLLIQEVEIE